MKPTIRVEYMFFFLKSRVKYMLIITKYIVFYITNIGVANLKFQPQK